jgi:hypothetical protein
MLRRILFILTAPAMLLAPVLFAQAAQAQATVTMMCTQFGTALLPANAPPVKGGIITVEVNGQIITTHAVPGPCNAPGFVKVALGG